MVSTIVVFCLALCESCCDGAGGQDADVVTLAQYSLSPAAKRFVGLLDRW